MNKFFLTLILMSTVSCAVTNEPPVINAGSFLNAVKGKSIFQDGSVLYSFSSDGKIIDLGRFGTGTFTEIVSEERGIYTVQSDNKPKYFLGINYNGGNSSMYESLDKSTLFDTTPVSISIK